MNKYKLTYSEKLGIQSAARIIHQSSKNAGWWTGTDPQNKETKALKLCLIHSEVSECLEGVRIGDQDKHLPHRTAEEVELADAAIRIFDYAEFYGLDIASAMAEKLEYNQVREDHKLENRAKKGGKSF